MILEVRKLTADAKLPTKAYDGDAGWDLYSCENITIKPICGMTDVPVADGSSAVRSVPSWDYAITEVDVGIAFAIPAGYYGQVMCRSGYGKKGMRVHHGVVDAGYRGPVTVFVQNQGEAPITINKGDKIAQLLILPVPDVCVQEVTELSSSVRGEKGFGSSGG